MSGHRNRIGTSEIEDIGTHFDAKNVRVGPHFVDGVSREIDVRRLDLFV